MFTNTTTTAAAHAADEREIVQNQISRRISNAEFDQGVCLMPCEAKSRQLMFYTHVYWHVTLLYSTTGNVNIIKHALVGLYTCISWWMCNWVWEHDNNRQHVSILPLSFIINIDRTSILGHARHARHALTLISCASQLQNPRLGSKACDRWESFNPWSRSCRNL